MYLGIDLGTSNSAIVGYDPGKLRLFKTAEGTDVLPSAIMIDRRGAMFVGKRAYDQAAYSPENVAQGFKRLMGTSSTVTFVASGRTMTPEQASSEVLKALVAQAKMEAGEFEIWRGGHNSGGVQPNANRGDHAGCKGCRLTKGRVASRADCGIDGFNCEVAQQKRAISSL
ncbi:MAG: Hsp70 family protein [Xanthobacteraceae bacterium]